MKSISQKLIIFGAAIVLIFSGMVMISNAEEDTQGDVWHHKVSADGTTWTYEESTVEKNDIDIKEISYSSDGTTLTVTMEVYGTIQSSANYAYMFYFNTSDATYIFTYVAGVASAIGYDWDYYLDMGSFDPMDVLDHMTFDGALTAEGSNLTGTVSLLGTDEASATWGYATEYLVDYTEITGQVEWWGDYWPDTFSPWYGIDTGDDDTGDDDTGDDDTGDDDTGDDDTGDDDTGESNGGTEEKTPGFELLTLIAAIAIALIILRKRR